jgi:hypothetical protein
MTFVCRLFGGLCLLLCMAAPGMAAPALELYGTIHAMGVIVDLGASDDPNGDAVAAVQYRKVGEAFQQGFPLARLSGTRFVGSLFWLQPGTSYEVRVTFSDPTGDPLDGVIVASTAATRVEPTVFAASHSRYAAPGGSGSACTEAAPGSLATALSQVLPGEEVVLRGGVYRVGEMSLSRSGTANAPIVIRSFTGETAILDGADPDTFTWTHIGGGVWQTAVHVGDPHLVTVDGNRLYPYQSLSDLQNLVWGIPGFYASGTTLSVRLENNANPNNTTMAVSRYNYAFYVEQDFIVFRGLTFRNYGQGDFAKAVYLRNASDVLIEQCQFAVNDVGVGIKGDAHRNVIQNNTFYDTVFDWPWEAVKAGSNLETGGVVFYDPTAGRGNVIRRNTFHDYFDGLHTCPSSTAGVTNETDVYENLVYRAGDDGLETDGQCSNVRIWKNTFHDVLNGISLAPVYTGPVYAIRNVIYRTGVGNNNYTGSPFKFNSGYDTSGPMYLFHNTCDAALPGNNGLCIQTPGTWSLIYARNNIWAGTNYAIENYNANQPVDIDYDALWRETSGDLVLWGGTHYATLHYFTAGTGQEPHGLHASPQFTDRANGNYTLQPGSRLIDAGVIIPGINDKAYKGRSPDMGAFESERVSAALPAWLLLLDD